MLKIRLNLRRVVAVAICLAGSMTMFAQDIIIRNNGAEIQAIVSEVGVDYIRYKRFDNQTGPTYRLNKSEISMIRYEDGSRDVFGNVSRSNEGRQQAPTYQRNYDRNNYGYSRQQPPVSENSYDNQYDIPAKPFRFAVDVGFSYRIAKASKDLDALERSFINKMRAGFLYGADFHGFFTTGFGLGAKFTGHYYSRTEMGFKDQVSTYYIAPSLMWRAFNRKMDVVYYSFSLGYVNFNDKWSYNGLSESYSNGGLGTTFDFGYDLRLNRNNFLGFKLTYTNGNIELDIKNSSGNNFVESLAAIDLSVGFRF